MASLPQVQGTWRLGARSALDIRRPREAGGRACVDLGVQLVRYQISNSIEDALRASTAAPSPFGTFLEERCQRKERKVLKKL